MYCPQCATANAGDVKFCRSCGLELETVMSALTKPRAKKPGKADSTAEDWIDTRIKGVSAITRGSILMAVSFLLILPFALFLPSTFDAPWILIWTVFFGWMTVWGGIEVAYGLSSILESRSKSRLLGEQEMAIQAKRHETVLLNDRSHTNPDSVLAPVPRASVTEGTTRQLKE
jgi:hypothetical protein